jgi:hypothetical protein
MNSVNSFINNKIQEEFGKTITLDQFNKLNDGIVDYLKTQDKGSGYTLDSSYDGNRGEYVFDIQEVSLDVSLQGYQEGGGENWGLLGNKESGSSPGGGGWFDTVAFWTQGVPVLGSSLSSGQKLARGDYFGATIDFGYSLLELFTLGASTGSSAVVKGASKAATGVAEGGEKAIVIGEGMYRVKPAARSVGAKWYQAWSKNFPSGGQLMTEAELNAAKARNARWLNSKINQGYKIYDIGPKGPNITSPFYQLERDIIQKTSYPTTPLIGF